jgi:hypothetical protein
MPTGKQTPFNPIWLKHVLPQGIMNTSRDAFSMIGML